MNLKFGLNKNIEIFLFSDILYWGAISIVGTFLSILITLKVAPGDIEAVGLVVAIYMVVSGISGLPISIYTRRLSAQTKLKLFSCTYFIYGIIVCFMGFSTALWQIIAFRVVIGVIEGGTYPLKWTLFSKIQTSGDEETTWSIESLTSSLAAAFFAFLAGYIGSVYELSFVFIIAGILISLSGLGMLMIKTPSNPPINSVT